MPSNTVMIRKLQQALNGKGMRITYATSQFYSATQDRPVTVYSIRQAEWEEESKKYINHELYKATSQIQVVLFLRDLWYIVNGKELPKADEKWQKIRESIEIFNSQKGE